MQGFDGTLIKSPNSNHDPKSKPKTGALIQDFMNNIAKNLEMKNLIQQHSKTSLKIFLANIEWENYFISQSIHEIK